MPEDEWITIDNNNIEEYYSTEYYKKETTTNSGALYVTKADTWLKTTSKEVSELQTPSVDGEGEDPSVVKDSSTEYVIILKNNQYIVINTRIRITETTKTSTKSRSYTVTDQENQINVEDFINLIKKYPKVRGNLESAPEMIFDYLQRYENTQKLEKVMRYVLMMLTGNDYGVSEEQLEALLSETYIEFSGVNSLSSYLRQFSHSTEAPKSSDGNYYLMYGDGAGWPTIGNADLQWKSHHGKFAKAGKVLEDGVEKEVENVEEYVNSKLPRGATEEYTDEEVSSYKIYVEVDLVDEVGDSVQQTYYNVALNSTNGLDLSRQQLYALTAVAYNFGNIPERNGKTFKQTYEDGVALYEINSWEHNRYIWDNWWAYLNGGYSGHIPARDAAYETYVKGIFDFTNSDAGEVFGRRYYIYYTQAQLNYLAEHMEEGESVPNKSVTRTASNEEEIFTYVEFTGGISGTVTIDGYEFEKYTSSNGKTYIWYFQDYGPWSTQVSSGGSTFADAGCFCTSTSIVASGYGDTTRPSWSRSIYEFSMTSRQVKSPCNDPSGGTDLTSAQIQEIQEWLFNGGEVIIHVVGSGRSGWSSYTNNQHWMPLVDISEDGQQVYIMNTCSNYSEDKYGWNDINKVAQSVNCYHLIEGLGE